MLRAFNIRKILLFLAPGVLALYFFIDPAQHLFPRCIFLQATDWECPGCGSQRAVHALLHLDFAQAFALNPLLVISLPYILLGLFLEYTKPNQAKLKIRRIFYGYKAIMIVLITVILFWILRNIY